MVNGKIYPCTRHSKNRNSTNNAVVYTNLVVLERGGCGLSNAVELALIALSRLLFQWGEFRTLQYSVRKEKKRTHFYRRFLLGIWSQKTDYSSYFLCLHTRSGVIATDRLSPQLRRQSHWILRTGSLCRNYGNKHAPPRQKANGS